MNNIKINDSTFYIGVNDRTTDRFENLWSLPFGVSYNSYIVKGDQYIAMIDSVEESSTTETLNKIKAAIGDKTIDYLIINHMEPDHSGGIPILVKEFPEIKIVGNRQTMNMIKGFYEIDDKYLYEIKDGDILNLGGKTLKFILTPLVHWPETMMTWLEEDKTLFTGDAFGCFGALDGGVLDTELDTELYFREMYRYYACIVGKYGKPVQMALKKTSGLDIKYICSTHGPVWHENISEVVSIYDRLSKYESEEGVTIIYGSMYGNTARIAEAIARRLAERGIKKIKVYNAAKADLSMMITDAFRYKGLIVGAPTYSMRLFPPVEQFMTAMDTREIKNKIMALFGSFTWASAALSSLKTMTEKMNHEIVSQLEFKQAPTADAYEDAVKLADKVADALSH